MLSRDEILAIYAAGPEAVVALVEQLLATQAELTEQVRLLSARVAELEARLDRDSHNSHKPPSSDGPAKLPRRRSRRQRSGKASGGQAGHPGTTLTQVAAPDTILAHSAPACTQCGGQLDTAPVVARERRQVVDLPVVRPQVAEHQVLHQRCPVCQTISTGQFPASVTQPVQYGPQVKALAVYLQEYQHLPFERTQELFRDAFSLPLSEGTLATTRDTCAEQLASVAAAIHQALQAAPVAHFDETGARIAGRAHWLHVASTARLTHYAVHTKRGQTAMDAIGILPAFGGTAVHDVLSGYFQYDCQHSLCNAHLLRDLTAVSESTRQRWPQRLLALLLTIKTAVERAIERGQGHLAAGQVANLTSQYQQLLKSGLRANPAPKRSGRPGRPANGPIRALLLRLKTHQAAVLAFLNDLRVPFDNNQAERDLRMVKVRQKVSGGFRSWRGAEVFCRIRGYISTMRKQGHNALTVLRSVFDGHPLMPCLTAE
jgi:transposase